MFEGDSIVLRRLPDGFVELCFDRRGSAINRFDARTRDELDVAVTRLADARDLAGVLMTSAKQAFVGDPGSGESADRVRTSEDDVARDLWRSNVPLMAFEDLQVPTVAAINGDAPDVGCEMALTAAWRVMDGTGQIGLPQVAAGFFPGHGGTVRLPRVASVPAAIDWVANGRSRNASEALVDGVVDEVCPRADLHAAGLAWLRRAARGEVDWRTRQTVKRVPVPLPPALRDDLFRKALARVSGDTACAHPSAASMAIALMARTTPLQRDAAQWHECEAFAAATRIHPRTCSA